MRPCVIFGHCWVVQEVWRQFCEMPGAQRPDYGHCVDVQGGLVGEVLALAALMAGTVSGPRGALVTRAARGLSAAW
jgi:Na+/H+-translocating membrane pyrophosphatase